ncbi:VC_2705 family sodium/solute symporter [Niveibacterium terrae]|uniref:VC_2705 family sodium/solute symporter n=1 Tax=Niveibacterium terrae TaxID=3373598 RepID=UPI003A8D156A
MKFSLPVPNLTAPRRLAALSLAFTFTFLALLWLLYSAETRGLSPRVIGYLFLLAPLVICATLGAVLRTTDSGVDAARPRIPAIFSAMVSAAQWISVAGLLGLAGALYASGPQALAYPLGWMAGYLLLAVLIAPRLRVSRLGRPVDFLSARFGGHLPRLAGVAAVALTAFVYALAQITVIGLIVSHFARIRFEAGVFVGLAAVLMLSFIGELRKLSWVQVIQFLFRALAFLIPVILLCWQFANQTPFGTNGLAPKLESVEAQLLASPHEAEVRELHLARAEQLRQQIAELPDSLTGARSFARAKLDRLLAKPNSTGSQIAAALKALRELPRTPEEARQRWSGMMAEDIELARPPRPFAALPDGAQDGLLALIVVLMLGTAAMPHLVERASATPPEAPARQSVPWTLLLILVLLAAAPLCALFAKWLISTQVVGLPFDQLPEWIAAWSRQGLIRIDDINQDGILQLAELSLNPDLVVLALPEMAGLPYVATGLIASAALAAALAMADARLQAISRALTDEIARLFRPASTQRRLVVAKLSLLIVALGAAALATQRPESILTTVGFAFALAAAGLFPALALGLFWPRANRWGATAGMLTGLGLTLVNAVRTLPFFGGSPASGWLGLGPVPGALIGVLAGFVVIVVVSLLTPRPTPDKNSSSPRLEKSTD